MGTTENITEKSKMEEIMLHKELHDSKVEFSSNKEIKTSEETSANIGDEVDSSLKVTKIVAMNVIEEPTTEMKELELTANNKFEKEETEDIKPSLAEIKEKADLTLESVTKSNDNEAEFNGCENNKPEFKEISVTKDSTTDVTEEPITKSDER